MKFIYYLLPLISLAIASTWIQCPCQRQDCSKAADKCACDNVNIVNKYFCCDGNTTPPKDLGLQDCKVGVGETSALVVSNLHFCGGPLDLKCSAQDSCFLIPGNWGSEPHAWGLCERVSGSNSTTLSTSITSTSSITSSSVPVSTSTSTVVTTTSTSSKSSSTPKTTSTAVKTITTSSKSSVVSASTATLVLTGKVVPSSTLLTITTVVTRTTTPRSDPTGDADDDDDDDDDDYDDTPATLALGCYSDQDCTVAMYCDHDIGCPPPDADGQLGGFMGWKCTGTCTYKHPRPPRI